MGADRSESDWLMIGSHGSAPSSLIGVHFPFTTVIGIILYGCYGYGRPIHYAVARSARPISLSLSLSKNMIKTLKRNERKREKKGERKKPSQKHSELEGVSPTRNRLRKKSKLKSKEFCKKKNITSPKKKPLESRLEFQGVYHARNSMYEIAA